MMNGARASAGRRRVLCIAVALTAALASVPATASAVSRALRERAGAGAAKPFYDSRVGAAARAGAVGTSAERSARRELRQDLGRQASIQVDPLTETARTVQKLNGTLTGPATGERADVAMRWVRANRTALGLTAADVSTLTLSDRSVDKGSGFTFLRYRQSFRGIPTFDGGLRVNLDRGGRILNVTGAPISRLSVPSVSPRLSAADALGALQTNIGVRRPIDVTSGPAGVRQITRFARGDFARLVLFDGPDGTVLAWHVLYRATSLALYDAVVDATSGRILFRQNLTKFDDAAQDVFPDYPGAERDPDNPDKAANNAKLIDVPFEGNGWLPDAATTLSGPNAHVYTDADDDNEVDDGEEVTRADGDADFNDVFDPFQAPGTNACDFDSIAGWPEPLGRTADCAWDPDTPDTRDDNREQAGVQAFYFVNDYHDHLESTPIGFTDDNFEGDDPVEVNADDGMDTVQPVTGTIPDDDHVNNANMSTPPDGASPLMQMYLFRFDPDRFFAFRNIDGDDDAGTVWHEYTHGLSNRLVTHDDGSGALSSPHSGAMGEAWSDWYALDLLHRRGLEIDTAPDEGGQVDIGIYTDATFTATRFEPIDCRPTPEDEANDRCPGGFDPNDTGTGGFTFGDFGHVAGAPEVHSDGEIWMQTLWDLRTALVAANGGDEQLGSDAAEQLVTQAMRLSPPEPSFLDMRNAILAADTGLGNTRHNLIWKVFADRGMGYFAGVADSSDVAPVEDFHMPPAATAAKGRVAGTTTSADTGLPLPSVSIGFGGLGTAVPFAERLAPVTSAANGSYSLQAPAGTYGDLVYDRPGWDRVVARPFTVRANATAIKNVALRRDWAATRGGAAITQVSDDTSADFGCGVAGFVDQSLGIGWSAFNPDSDDEGNPHAGPPTATIRLPQTIDISAFGMDPGATCGDDETATTRSFRVQTSADGVHFAVARIGTFTTANAGRLNIVRPTANSRGVRYVRLTLLSPQSDEVGDSGHDFIDFSEFEVFGGPRNVLPTGTLSASPTSVKPRQTVTFRAAFTDPDSKITGYGWDFDGNGTVDRNTTSATTTFAYTRAGDFTARVRANDFRGGAGTASRTVHVTSGPKIRSLKGGTKGRAGFRVTCELRCKVTAKLTLSKKLAKQLGLKKKRTVGTLKRTLAAGSSKRLTIKLTRKAKRALERHDRKSVKVKLAVKARYPSDGRSASRHKTVKVKR
jgi:extracellular elastinolytic metalloproteinase